VTGALVAAAAAVLLLLLIAVLLADGPRGGAATTAVEEPTAAEEPTVAAEPTRAAEPTGPAAASPDEAPAPFECVFVPDGEPARPVAPPGPEPGPEPALLLLLRTTVGDIDVVLDAEQAPCAAHSLRTLAEAGFYDDTPCHRLVDRGVFILQCGDPTGTGRGGPGYRFAEEALAEVSYARGTVALVNSGPATTGSQFFLVYEDSPLPAQYTPVGTIGEAGLEVLDRVAAAGAGPLTPTGATPPLLPVQVLAAEVTPTEPLPEE
jgi:peptidyl-prolyl cis-trans isomerase B (cyclophilin B)